MYPYNILKITILSSKVFYYFTILFYLFIYKKKNTKIAPLRTSILEHFMQVF